MSASRTARITNDAEVFFAGNSRPAASRSSTSYPDEPEATATGILTAALGAGVTCTVTRARRYAWLGSPASPTGPAATAWPPSISV